MLKKAVIIFAALVVFVVAIPNFMDWNPYKPMLLKEIETRTGARISMEGTLSLSIFPTIKLTATQIGVKNIPGLPSTSIISIEKLACVVKLWPLLSKQVVVDSFSIKGGTFRDKTADGNDILLQGIGILGTAPSLQGNVQADVDVASIHYGPYEGSNFKTNVVFHDNKLTLSNLTCKAYEGDISGSVSFENQKVTSTIKVDVNVAALPFAKGTPLKKGRLLAKSEKLNFSIHSDHVISTVSGDVSLDLRDGEVETIDVASLVQRIQHIKTLKDIQDLQNHLHTKAPLAFKHLQMQASLKQSQMHIKNLEFVSDFVTLNGKGNVNLPACLLNIFSTICFKDLKNVPPIPLMIEGTLDAPKFSLDQKRALEIFAPMLVKNVTVPVIEGAKKQIRNKLKDMVESVVGTPANDNTQKKGPDLNPEKIIQGLFGR